MTQEIRTSADEQNKASCRPEALDPKRYARPGTIWVCGACGKTADLDCYGIEGKYDRGWDESCMLNAVLCDASTLKRDGYGRVYKADAAPHVGQIDAPQTTAEA